MSSTVEDGDLIAYFHGRLPGDEARTIGRRLESDSELAARYQALTDEIDALVVALDPACRMPPRPRIEAMIRAATNDAATPVRNPRLRAPSRSVMLQAIAASALLALGLAGGLGLSEWRQSGEDEHLSAAERDLVAARAETRQAALELVASGESYAIAAEDRQWSVEVTPVRTFQNAHGKFCREFLEVWDLAGAANGEVRIACREDTGAWRTIATLQPD